MKNYVYVTVTDDRVMPIMTVYEGKPRIIAGYNLIKLQEFISGLTDDFIPYQTAYLCETTAEAVENYNKALQENYTRLFVDVCNSADFVNMVPDTDVYRALISEKAQLDILETYHKACEDNDMAMEEDEALCSEEEDNEEGNTEEEATPDQKENEEDHCECDHADQHPDCIIRIRHVTMPADSSDKKDDKPSDSPKDLIEHLTHQFIEDLVKSGIIN